MILITGGTGFVGRHLQDELTRRGLAHAVFSQRDYDLTVKEQADAVFHRFRDADLVLHFACYQAAGLFPARHTADQIHVNSLIHMHVLDAWRRHLPKAKLIAVGSSCAYPTGLAVMTEDRILDGPPDASVYAYAATKRLLYTGLLAYNDQCGLNGSYVIPPTLFGEYDDFHVDTAHVCGALVGKFVKAVRGGLPEVEIWGDGEQTREFMYVKDFARVLIDLSTRIDRDVLNVGPGCGTSIRALAEGIAGAAGFQGRLAFNPSRYVGVKDKFLTATKLDQKYGVRLGNDLTEGIRRTVSWYASQDPVPADRPKFDGGRS